MRNSHVNDRRPAGRAGSTSLARAAAGLSALALLAGCAARKGRAAAPAPTGPPATATAGAVVGDRDVTRQNAVRLEEMFAGRFPGVQVYQQGGGVVIRVRGQTTLNGSSEPLFVLDGQPMVQGNGGVIDVNPNDIARIEVLRSATDLAMYGSRSANGVVRITTKRGGPRSGT
jgi:TonB-dependent SusC/RagA subfamily outer membrane receptor